MDLIEIIDIEGIRVYDPTLDERLELDLNGYRQRLLDNYHEAIILYLSLKQKVLDSFVADGTTLRDYLFGNDGYFTRNPLEQEVMFINGRFAASTKVEGGFVREQIKMEVDKHNGIPFTFKQHLTSPSSETKN